MVQLARKTKAQNETEENKGSEAIESVEETTDEVVAAQPESESDLTEEVSEASDSAEEDSVETEFSAEQTENDAETEEPVDSAESSEVETSTEDDIIDAELVEADEETVDTEPQEDVPTEIAGVVPAAAEATQTPEPTPQVQPAPAKGPGAVPLIFGGLAAGAIGFLAATFAPIDQAPEPTVAAVTGPDEETLARIESLSGKIAGLSERLDNLPVPTSGGGEVDFGPLTDRLDVLEGGAASLGETLAALETTVAGLDAEVTALAERPAVVAPDGSAAMEAQLESFRGELDAVTASARAEIEEAQARASQIEAEAAATAAAAQRNAAISELRAAMESGTPFSGPLQTLGDAPEALVVVADTGVVPLSELQDGFPDQARTVLQGAQGLPEDASATDRFTAFLRKQTNARSLAPREGEDVDAVLSRAEAALTDGDLVVVLAELEALPPDAAVTMQDWIDAAKARADAEAALNQLN